MEHVYTQRTASPILDLTTELPETARRRILIVLTGHVAEHMAGDQWENLRIELLKRYGGLHASHYRAAARSDNAAVEHFFTCPSERAIDFIELFFRQIGYSGGQEGVEEVNQVLREEGVAFAFSPYIEHESGGFFRGRKRRTTTREYPRAIPRGDQILDQTLTEPALHALSDSRFVVANKEMLDAYGALRRGDWENAITLSCSAFESVLRTICGLKGWPVDSNATCSALVSACQAHGLFPGLYAPAFNAVGTIRNKLGSAHGRGPSPLHIVSEAEATHAVNLAAANATLLVTLAQRPQHP